MKLYYSPGACSLASHIALCEVGQPFETERVDLKSHTTSDGGDFYKVNPKGYVPALVLDDGETLSENVALLDWIASKAPTLRPSGAMGQTHLLEALAFISTEIHKSFGPFFKGASDADKSKAGELIGKRFAYLADTMKGDYLFGADFSVADAYLFVMLRWADKFGIAYPPALATYRDRIADRPAVVSALAAEGLS